MRQRLIRDFGVFFIGLVILGATAAHAQQQNTNPPDIETHQYQDWQVRCPKDDARRCEMTQLVKSPDTGKPILRVVMGYPPEIDSAAMIFVLPLGTRLAPGVQFQVDNGKTHKFPFQICLKQGCRADFPVKDDLRGRLRAGHAATVSLIGPRGDRIDLDVSLQGFTAADNRLRR